MKNTEIIKKKRRPKTYKFPQEKKVKTKEEKLAYEKQWRERKSALPSKIECYKIIARWYDRNFMVSLQDLNLLIDIYEVLGGYSEGICAYPASKQFQLMWEHCNNKFREEYKKILETEL